MYISYVFVCDYHDCRLSFTLYSLERSIEKYQGDIDPREDDYRDEINLREEEIDLIKADTY